MNDLISRQAVIDVLEERLQANGYSNVALVSELNRSIGYLMRLPSAQRESCEYWDAESNYCTLNRPLAQPVSCKSLLELTLETSIKSATHGEVRLLLEDAKAILEELRMRKVKE